jgi:protein gp37
MAMARRLEAMGVEKYRGLTRISGGRPVWTGEVRQDWTALQAPLKWQKSKRIFVNSMSDLFHPKVEVAFIRAVWEVMRQTPHHTYQILTKRPQRMAEVLHDVAPIPLPHVWLGTSVENREAAGRINILRSIPAAVRFVSFEPLLGPVGNVDLIGIQWAIVGGESGPGARPMKKEWVEQIQSACEPGTAFFFKQWGAWGQDGRRRSKKQNGRIFRGRTWNYEPSGEEVLK